MILLAIYLLIGFFWGVFACAKQMRYFPESSTFKVLLTGTINGVAWPLSVAFAVFIWNRDFEQDY